MKKMKIIRLIGIILALFTLTSCDAILEAFYPDFAAKFDGETNTVSVYVLVSVPPELDFAEFDPMIAAKVVDAGKIDPITDADLVVWPFWNWNNKGEILISAHLDLSDIPSGSESSPYEYRIVVWLENTTGPDAYNYAPDDDEPTMDAEYFDVESGATSTVFRFPSTNGAWVGANATLTI